MGEGHYQQKKQRDQKLEGRRVQGPGGLENRRAGKGKQRETCLNREGPKGRVRIVQLIWTKML